MKNETMDAKKVFAIFLFQTLVIVLASDPWSGEFDYETGDVAVKTRHLFPRNFASVRINAAKEKELRIVHDRMLFLETSVESEFMPGIDMVIRQLTDGRRLVQAVYQGGTLKECDFNKESQQILDFVVGFSQDAYVNKDAEFGDIFEAHSAKVGPSDKNKTIAYKYYDRTDDLKEFASFVDLRTMRKKCRAFYKVANTLAKAEAKSGNITDIYAEVIKNDLAQYNFPYPLTSSEVDGQEPQDRQTHGRKITKRSTDPVKRSRTKRGAFDFGSVLIFPGTKWCGKGDLAKCYDDLGDDKELDSCCRDHDCCPYVIPPFTSKFNMFNYRFHSLLHCECDQRFRGCLRQSVSSMASMIGKIYFNILGSKCFEFQEEEVCVERNWWGTCRKTESQVTGLLRSQKSFNEETHHTDILPPLERVTNET